MLVIPKSFMHSHNVRVVHFAHQLNLVEWIRAGRDLLLDDPSILLLLRFLAILVRIFFIYFLYLDHFDCTVCAGLPLHAVPNLSKCPY